MDEPFEYIEDDIDNQQESELIHNTPETPPKNDNTENNYHYSNIDDDEHSNNFQMESEFDNEIETNLLNKNNNYENDNNNSIIIENNNKIKQATDADFVDNFYSKSRLHHLSNWRTKFQQELNEFLQDLSQETPPIEHNSKSINFYNQNSHIEVPTKSPTPEIDSDEDIGESDDSDFEDNDNNNKPRKKHKIIESKNRTTTTIKTINKRIVVHIDMDCFFASVAVKYNPVLTGRPVAVSHSTSIDGTADIASCNYEYVYFLGNFFDFS